MEASGHFLPFVFNFTDPFIICWIWSWLAAFTLDFPFVCGFQLYRIIILLLVLNALQFMMQYSFCNCIKHFFYVNIVFGWCFKKLNVHLFGKTLCILCDNHFLIGIIVFITDCRVEEGKKNRKRKFQLNPINISLRNNKQKCRYSSARII